MNNALRASLATLLLVAVLPVGAAGKTYRWVDAQGKVHYGDQPPPYAAEINPLKPGTVKSGDTLADADDPPRPAAGALGPEECQRRRDQLASYRNAAAITETDGLGNKREYGDDERRKLIARSEQTLRDGCPN